MGRELPPGIEVRGDSIRVTFTVAGERCRETLTWSPTAANIARAGRLRARIVDEIRHGCFRYEAHFPDSPRVRAAGRTFAEAAQIFLNHKAQSRGWAASYCLEMRRLLDHYWMPTFWNRPVRNVTTAEVRETLDKMLAGKSAKTYNNVLAAGRGVFRLCHEDGIIDRDPTAPLEARPSEQADDPDPFAPEEVRMILEHIRAKHGTIWWAWFAFAFWSGMRPSEQRGLLWPDTGADMVVVRRAVVRSNAQERTKTRRKRTVRLNAISRQALDIMRAETALAGGSVFVHPKSRMPIRRADAVDAIWKSTLKTLRIRYRNPYQTRHTYASTCLSSGMSLAFVASQLGHSIATCSKHYARWLDVGVEREMRKLEALTV
ncbi:MAG: tyrosine-type recombinase/integrase [Pseudomonadota bacterium]